MSRSRRSLLALLCALTGCLGFGNDRQVTPVSVTDSPPERSATPTAPGTTRTRSPTDSVTPTDSPTATRTPTDSPTATDTATPTGDATETTTDTASPVPTPTPFDRTAPPAGSLAFAGESVTVAPVAGSAAARATVSVTLRNTGEVDVTFSVIQLRIDLLYERIGGGSRQVGTGYLVREYDGEGGLGPGGSVQLSGSFRFEASGIDGTESDDRFGIRAAYRRVRYR